MVLPILSPLCHVTRLIKISSQLSYTYHLFHQTLIPRAMMLPNPQTPEELHLQTVVAAESPSASRV